MIQRILEARVADGTRCLDLNEMQVYRRLRDIHAGHGTPADRPLLEIELRRRGLPIPTAEWNPANPPR